MLSAQKEQYDNVLSSARKDRESLRQSRDRHRSRGADQTAMPVS